jgi:hypothetical protein
MSMVWGAVNNLQLIVHFPLMSLGLPSNVSYFLGMLIDLINFKIIPTDKILEKVFKLKKSAEDTTSGVLTSLGYEST